MRQPHKPVLELLAYLAVALAMIGGGSHRACAQDATLPGGTQIFVTPYLWLLDSALEELGTRRLAVLLDACRAESIGIDGAEDTEIVHFDPRSIVSKTGSGCFVVASLRAWLHATS